MVKENQKLLYELKFGILSLESHTMRHIMRSSSFFLRWYFQTRPLQLQENTDTAVAEMFPVDKTTVPVSPLLQQKTEQEFWYTARSLILKFISCGTAV